MNMTSLLRRHVYTERSQLVQYFTHSFITCQLLNITASYEYQKNECVRQWNLFKCQISTFYFSTYCIKFIWTLIDTHRSDRVRDATAAIAASVVETTHRTGLIHQRFLVHKKILTPNMYRWSCKTFVTIYWTHLRLRVNGIWAKSFCPEKMNNRKLFLTGCFRGSIATFMVEKWRHSDVIIVKLTAVTQN